jgi:hypothetical protein
VLPTEVRRYVQSAREGPAGERRWQELYAKQEGAWKAGMAQDRDEQPESLYLDMPDPSSGLALSAG